MRRKAFAIQVRGYQTDPMHMLGAFATENGFVLGISNVREKSVREYENFLNSGYSGGCYHNAADCHKVITSHMRGNRGEVPRARTGNQEKLHDEVVHLFRHAWVVQLKEVDGD